MRIILINIFVFVVIRISYVVFAILQQPIDLLAWIGCPSSIYVLLMKPWTIITYMFVQYDIMHIVFNMLWLFWFGKMFLMSFNSKQLSALYIYGGVGGAILYIIVGLLIPSFGASPYLIGASASVVAIVVATAMRMPNYPVGLLFFGDIKLKWIAIATIFIDIISLTTNNIGGHISHLGGAMVGALFALGFARGKDITQPFNRCIDSFVSMFTYRKNRYYVGKKPNVHKKTSVHTSDQNDIKEMDAILEKIKKSGYTSLTDNEKSKLFDVSKKI